MASFDEFKKFISDKPYLKEKVKLNKTTWQELYERFDLYGPSDDIFKEDIETEKEDIKEETKEESKENTDDSFSSFFNLISGIDVDKISDGLNGMKKILNILSEVTATEDVTSFSKRRGQKPYKRDDD